MGSAPGMESLLSGPQHRSGRAVLLACLVAMTMGAEARTEAQAVAPPEREALIQLQTSRGGRAQDVDALIRVADEAAAMTR